MTARTLGVLGSLTWDRFVRPPPGVPETDRRVHGAPNVDRPAHVAPEAEDDAGAPGEGWGGIAYALAALSASLPDGWTALPLLKIGSDLFDEGLRFLRSIPRVDPSALVAVGEPNNRVELRYESPGERSERLVGGVPPWTAHELVGAAGRCDALYVNFVSGLEMDLAAARALARAHRGFRYADLHSLFLGVDPDGRRIARPLDDAWSWAGCFHAVQMNEEEFRLASGGRDPWARATSEVARGDDPGLIAITLGPRGAACVRAADFALEPRRPAGRSASGVAVETTTAETEPRAGDPTGCGDVWGATFFARLLAGDALAHALDEANRLAGLNVEHRSAERLADRLAASGADGRRPRAGRPRPAPVGLPSATAAPPRADGPPHPTGGTA